jgi:hypothetical protein
LTLPRRSSIREFRDALKTKYADSHLKGIAPETLKIFAPGADSPFEFDHIIGELGESKNDPLIVMVPPPVWFQFVGADSLPFKGSRVNSLRLSRRSSIVEFCDAVKAENPNVLFLIDSSQLTVFEKKCCA